MERGQEFGRYDSFKSERVLVYFKGNEIGQQPPGWLYWSDNLKRDDRPQNRLAIAEGILFIHSIDSCSSLMMHLNK
jgi:hypothetical protein